jgi:hypothetical protein
LKVSGKVLSANAVEMLGNDRFLEKRTHTKVRFSPAARAAIFVPNSGLAESFSTWQSNDGTS